MENWHEIKGPSVSLTARIDGDVRIGATKDRNDFISLHRRGMATSRAEERAYSCGWEQSRYNS